MVLRVTFDTHYLDSVCRPERPPNNCRQMLPMRKVHDALTQGGIEGFYSVTMLTIEGMMRKDRAGVFAGTRTVMQPETTELTKNVDLPDAVRETVGAADLETIRLETPVEQPDRKPLRPEPAARIRAAKAVGVKVLKAVPRIGAYHIKDPSGEYYLDPGEGDALKAWIDKACAVARAIEARGVGIAQIKELGHRLDESDSLSLWFQSLDRAGDKGMSKVPRAFAEWADGDSIAAHVAYGLDFFCSCDFGKSNPGASVLDHANRAWLSETYGVQFATLEELAARLP